MKTVFHWIIQFSWGIVQNVMGLALTAFLRLFRHAAKRPPFFGAVVTKWRRRGSMALGGYIFLGKNGTEEVLVHEYGHTVQSLILGPFFLPVIGLPSLIWANFRPFRRYRERKQKRYTSFYPERWASFAGERSTGRKASRA